MALHEVRVEWRLLFVAEQIEAGTNGELQLIGNLPIVLQAEGEARASELGRAVIRIEAWNRVLIDQTPGIPRLEIGDGVEIICTEGVLHEQVEDVGLGVAKQRLELMIAGIQARGEVNREIIRIQRIGMARLDPGRRKCGERHCCRT